MAFEQTRFTIVVNAAGSGTWRMWNYMPSPDAEGDDFEEAGHFGAMTGHIHAGDMLVVATRKSVRLMAFAIGQEDGVIALPMTQADMPRDNEQPMPQVLPMGTQPTSGVAHEADDGKHEAVSRPVAAHMEHNSPAEPAEPAAPAQAAG